MRATAGGDTPRYYYTSSAPLDYEETPVWLLTSIYPYKNHYYTQRNQHHYKVVHIRLLAHLCLLDLSAGSTSLRRRGHRSEPLGGYQAILHMRSE